MSIIDDPNEIEKKSFEIISDLLDGRASGPNAPIVKRILHATADFEYLDNLVFTDRVLARTIETLKQGDFHVVTDTRMAESGINKRSLAALGGTIHCFVDSEEIVRKAKETGWTRSCVSMEHAVRKLSGPIVYVIGNAPTALLKLCELIEAGRCEPVLVIGVPVGFVNVVESKEKLLRLEVPSIVARGNKGGSNVAAAIFNAILYEAGVRTAPEKAHPFRTGNSCRFFRNTGCEYFPCHDDVDPETFNCLFCYCPLYGLGEHCGGRFEYTGEAGKIKCCTNCSLPHEEGGYDRIVGKLKELLRQND